VTVGIRIYPGTPLAEQAVAEAVKGWVATRPNWIG